MVGTHTHGALVARQSAASATGEGPTSLSSMLSTLVPLLVVGMIFFAFFIFMRPKMVRIYQPRTYLGSLEHEERTPKTTPSKFGWIPEFFSIPDTYVLNHHGLDAYLFLRYWRMMILIAFVGTCITWPILFPVFATGGNGGKQFDLLSWSNVNSSSKPNYFYAPVLCSWVFFAFVLYTIGRETLHYLALRQAYVLSPYIASHMSSRTVLFTDVPEHYLDEQRLRQMFPQVKHVWIATECDDLAEKVKERDQTAYKLEGAEITLSRDANNRRLKAAKKAKVDVENVQETPDSLTWLDDKKRPTHKLKFLIGKKVDTIEWSRDHLRTLIPEVEQEQSDHWNGKAKYIKAVFIEFETIQAAQSAFQQQVSHVPKHFQPRAIGAVPTEIVWTNLNKTWLMRDIKKVLANIIVVLIIVFWSVIISFGGFLSNIKALTNMTGLMWLGFLNAIPSQIIGVVTGLLPVIYVAVLMALVPIFLRLIAKTVGATTISEIELKTQGWYFAFQVVDVFLITTFASSASAVITQASSNPGMVPQLLAMNIPKASNFYINYFILQGVGISFKLVANVVAFALFVILGKLLDKSPRKMYNRYISLSSIGWGALYPAVALYGVVLLSYSVIAPLVLGFATVGLTLVYGAYRYNVIYCLDTSNIHAYGANYVKALQHLLVGVYIAELCIVGLLAITTGSGNPLLAGPLVLSIVLLVFTIILHLYFKSMVKPLMENLPRDLLAESALNNATPSQVAAGSHPALTPDSDEKVVDETEKPVAEPMLKTRPHGSMMKRFMSWLLHPNSLPEFAPYFAQPIGDYSDDIRREAYLNPAITAPTPFLWIVKDPMGISSREVDESGKVIGISDEGAWFNEKGKLTTTWVDQEKRGEQFQERKAPIYEPPVEY